MWNAGSAGALVHAAAAAWDIAGHDEADAVASALLDAWRDNDRHRAPC
ncbi:hypothetical protein [Streptomyces roseolus]